MTRSHTRLLACGEYVLAAEVAASSFLRYNPWFDGRVTIYTTAQERDLLVDRVGNLDGVDISAISPDFIALVTNALAEAPESSRWVIERFYSLALFAEPSDTDVLILDADLLFTGSVEALMAMPGTFVAASDVAGYTGCVVDRTTNELHHKGDVPASHCLATSFNSGVMRVSPEHLGPDFLTAAAEFLSPEVLGQITRRQHDQFVLNRMFEGAWTDCGPEFNYLIGYPHQVFEYSGLRMNDAQVLHFNREPRPWNLQALHRVTDPLVAKANAQWHAAMADMLIDRTLRTSVAPR